MRAFLLLPLQRFILSIRLRITEHIFTTTKKTTGKKLRVTLCIGCICAGSLFVYGIGIEIFGLTKLDYTNTSLYPEVSTLVGLLMYLLIILGITTGVSTFRASNKHNASSTASVGLLFIKECFLWIALLAGGYLILGQTSVLPIVTYYLLVAASEEGLKWLSSISLYKHHGFTTSDLILFALLVSLGFAFLENIIYMFQRTETIGSISGQLTGGSVVLFSRGLVGFLVHMLFTGAIAAGTVYSLANKKIQRLVGALILGIGLHMSYNILLYYNITIIVGIYVVLGYFGLSWLFWKSDGVYLSS